MNRSEIMMQSTMEELGIVFLIAGIFIYLVLLGIGIVSYVLSSYANYTIAKRRGINNPWLSWIPVANYYLTGRIANDYDKRNGYDRKWHKVLLALAVLFVILFVIFYVVVLVALIGMGIGYEYYGYAPTGSIAAVFLAYIGLIFAAIAGVALEFCYAICIYKTFESTNPAKALKYILLYLLVPLAGPICLYKCKDMGYPEPAAEAVFTEEPAAVNQVNEVEVPSEEAENPAEEEKTEETTEENSEN